MSRFTYNDLHHQSKNQHNYQVLLKKQVKPIVTGIGRMVTHRSDH